MSKAFACLKNERGESLLSIAMAAMIILIGFMVAAPSLLNSMNGGRNHLATPQFCRDIARNITAQIRSNGIQTKVHRAPIRQNSVMLSNTAWRNNAPSFNNINPDEVRNEHGLGAGINETRWPARAVMLWDPASERFVSNGPRLMYSAMNVLQAINNSNGNIACLNPEGLPINAGTGLDPLLPQATLDHYAEAGYFVSASIRTRPFSVADETIQPCNDSLQLRPYGLVEPPATDTLNITENLGGRYDPSQGIEAEVFVTVDHIDPEQRGGKLLAECSHVEKFQYDRVMSRIPAPRIEMGGASNVRVVLENPGENLNPGLFMACTYHWTRYNLADWGEIDRGGDDTLSRWRPCEEVRVCNVAIPPRITDIPERVVFDYGRSVPADCLLTVRAIAFDAIGNVSTATARGCLGPGCQDSTGFPDLGGGPIGGGPGGGGGPSQGYQVAGVTFSDITAAQQASALTGSPMVSIDLTMEAVANINSSNMRSHAAAISSISTTTASLNTAIGGLTADGSAGSVSAASAAVGAATANRDAAQAAVSAAQSMPDSMGAVKEAAVAEAEEALEEAEEALEAAEAALEAAEEAQEAAEDDDDEEP